MHAAVSSSNVALEQAGTPQLRVRRYRRLAGAWARALAGWWTRLLDSWLPYYASAIQLSRELEAAPPSGRRALALAWLEETRPDV